MATGVDMLQTTSDDRLAQGVLGDNETALARLAEIHEEASQLLADIGGAIEKPKGTLTFVKDLTYTSVGGQQLKCKCMFCGFLISSTGATRVVDHFLKCALCPPIVKDQCRALREGTAAKRKEKAEASDLHLQERELTLQAVKAQKTELVQQGIKAGFKSAEAIVADNAIAKFFYANGITFGAARDAQVGSYYHEMVVAIQNAPEGYTPPNSRALAGPLIDVCHGKMTADVAKRDEGCVLSSKFGATYTSDGWDSCDHLPLINSAIIMANDGGVYMRSVDTSGKTKTAEYVASLMIVDIYTIGCTKVVAVVTDTCSTMRKAWAIVEDEFPWISCLPCQTHCPSLLLTDIAKLKEPIETIKEETIVTGWFTNHQKPLAILREKVKAAFHGKTREVRKAGATRMGTNTFVGERLTELKGSLQLTVVDPEYVKQNYKDLPADHETSNCSTLVREHKGGAAKKLVLDDADGGFWQRVASHVAITMPICKLLRRFDTSAPGTGKVYSSWFEMGESIKASDASYKKEVGEKHAERWVYAHHPFFAAGYVCDPEFIDHEQASIEEVQEGLNETLEKIAILLKVRQLAAAEDKDDDGSFAKLWAMRKMAIDADPAAQSTTTNFPKYPTAKDKDVLEFCTKVSSQLVLYRSRKGAFGREFVMNSAEVMPAYLWWDQHGGGVPELQAFARLVLAQPASASICERINSEFEFVKDRWPRPARPAAPHLLWHMCVAHP
jgi:hypothetical protein